MTDAEKTVSEEIKKIHHHLITSILLSNARAVGFSVSFGVLRNTSKTRGDKKESRCSIRVALENRSVAVSRASPRSSHATVHDGQTCNSRYMISFRGRLAWNREIPTDE